MRLGIVGSEAAKFTAKGEAQARNEIKNLIFEAQAMDDEIPYVVSGECHLGGIDIYAKEIALDMNVGYIGHPPAKLNWSECYKPRNLQIAKDSDIVYCITVKRLPDNYNSMRFNGCYHCNGNVLGCNGAHIKSGGCWTAIQAAKMGKQAAWIILDNEE